MIIKNILLLNPVLLLKARNTNKAKRYILKTMHYITLMISVILS